MRIRSIFHIFAVLTVMLTISAPFVTFAQQNSGQHETEDAVTQDIDALRLEAKAAADQDARSDVNTGLWFCAGVGVLCIGSTVGGLTGFGVGSIINSKRDSGDYIGWAILFPNTTQIVGMFVGAAVGVLGPPIRIYNYQPNPPPERLIGKSPEYVEFYVDAYRIKSRSIRMKSVAAGAITGCGLPIIIGRLIN